MSLRKFLGELVIAVAVAILLLFIVGLASGGCAHNSPETNRGVDFLGAQESA